MELFFNSLWAALALACLCGWLHAKRGDKEDRRLTFVAVVMLIVILFPVISVSDDLWSLQNPAETDTCVRRLQAPTVHSTAHAFAGFPEPIAAEFAFAFLPLYTPLYRSLPVFDPLAHDALQNRPPPSA